jgi:hypothetical protein
MHARSRRGLPSLTAALFAAATIVPPAFAADDTPATVSDGTWRETAEPRADLGPLAVVAEGDPGDAAIGPGTLSIGTDCVTFEGVGAEEGVTLIWPGDSTSWRPKNRRILFEHPIRGIVRLSDGDRVMFGGHMLDGDSPETAARMAEAWTQPPDPTCPTAMWLVGQVRVPSSEGYAATPGAKARGWTKEEAKLQQKASRIVREVNRAIHDQRPDIWIGAALSETPGGAPSIYVKGPAPQFVRDLVAQADYLIAIVDEQPYSFDELEERSIRVFQALVDAGYPNVSSATHITGGGVIPAWVLKVGDLPAEPAEILAFVPEELRADVDLHVTIAPPRPSAEPGEWGPLAVLYWPQGFGPGVGLGPVTLHIDERCVWIEHKPSGHATTLVWEGNRVEWRPKNRRIVFTDRKGRTVRLSDGDRIAGGGSGISLTLGRGGEDQPDPERDTTSGSGVRLDEAWLQEPDPSCPAGLFYLDEVTDVERGR